MELDEIKRKTAAGEIEFTRNVLFFSLELGFDKAGILEFVASMEPGFKQKEMQSDKHPGVVQHVFRVPFRGQVWYVKFTSEGPHGLRLVTLKWKRKHTE